MELLPIDLKYEILKILPVSDIISLSQSNKNFQSICLNDILWNFLLKRDFGHSIIHEGKTQPSKFRYYVYKYFLTMVVEIGDNYSKVINCGHNKDIIAQLSLIRENLNTTMIYVPIENLSDCEVLTFLSGMINTKIYYNEVCGKLLISNKLHEDFMVSNRSRKISNDNVNIGVIIFMLFFSVILIII